MKTLIGTALIAAALALNGPAAVAATDKLPQAKSQAAKSGATDFSAHRRYYRHGYRTLFRSYDRAYYRPYPQPYYYARPVYYRPYPYSTPAPFIFGIGYGW